MYGHVDTGKDRLFLMEYLIEFYIIKVENINFYWETHLLLRVRLSERRAVNVALFTEARILVVTARRIR